MKNDPLKAPLTADEQRFASENFYLIGKYLKIRKLPFDEWFDVVVFRYLRSVKRWFAIPELHKHSFEIIAFYAMKSAIGHEFDRQKREIKTVSLDEVIPGTDGLTYADTVTQNNLNFIYYEDGEDMKINYNVALPEKRVFNGGQKSDEILAIEGFIHGKFKNMCFEYDTPEEAKRRCNAVQAYRRSKNHKEIYDVYRVEKAVYVVRLAVKK